MPVSKVNEFENVVFIFRLRKSLHLLGLQGLAKIPFQLPCKQYNESIFLGPYIVQVLS